MSPSIDSSQNIDILADLFETHFEEKPDSIVSLPISGSDRRYYRLKKDDKVAVGTFNDNVAENNSFFYFAELLRKHGVNVPEIYAIGKERRFYLQQDLGDTSLFDLLAKEGHTDEVKAYYIKAVEQLVKAQWMAGRECNFDQCFASKSFDEKAIMGDLMYFKYYFADLQKIPYDKQLLMEEMEQLSRELGRIQPQTLMYRDFQSRNIMVHEGEVYFIDFQGAMQGPPQYDLASLLWQAKAKLPDTWKEELMNSYVAAMDEIKIARVEDIHFRKGYLQFVLLRMLQVLGAYGFKGLLEHKPHFISSISPALANLQTYLSDNPQVPNYQELRALLEAVCSDEIQSHYKQPEKSDSVKLKVQITSFSYKKNGIPKDDTDHGGGYVFDCRGIKNPGRFKPYKHLSGLDPSVQNFLDRESRMPDFISQVYGLVSINIEDYISRDFDYLSINFGCTGGQHRSVYAAEQLAAYLKGKYNIPVSLTHTNKDNWVTEPE